MPVAELFAKIQVLPRAERLRLAREIVTSLIEEEDEFPVKPSDALLELAGIAQSSVRVDARDHAEDEHLERRDNEK
jgi:hypothetical protein